MKKPKESNVVFKVKQKHDNSVASLQCACANKLIIYITMHKQKAPIYKLSCSDASITKCGQINLNQQTELQ